MPQVKDTKTGMIKHFRYTTRGKAMAAKEQAKQDKIKKSDMSKYRRYA